ncbi:MAG: tetratricopeptide repeat protein [Desulfobulbus sp.]
MNGSLLAVLGVVVLLVVVLILKMRAGKSKPEVQLEGEQAVLDEVKETIAAEAVDELIEEPAEQEQVAKEEIPLVDVEEILESSVEILLAEGGKPESLTANGDELAAAAESVAVVESEQEAGVEESTLAEAIVADEVEQHAPLVAEEEIEAQEEAPPTVAESEVEEPVESAEVVEVEEIVATTVIIDSTETVTEDEQQPLAVEEEPEVQEDAPIPVAAIEGTEPAGSSATKSSDEPTYESVVIPDLAPSEKPVETNLLLVRLSMEEYADRLNRLEEQQRAALAEAIELHDDQRRDRLQRELVVMNDRLALLADHYVEEMASCQQALDTLTRLEAEEPSLALAEAISELQSGKTESAAAFLEKLSGQSHPLAAQAAFLCGQLAESRVDLQKAMAYYRQAVSREPDNPGYLRAAGLMARSLYKYKEALPWLESYVQLVKDGGPVDAKAVALAQRELAYTYVLSGQYQKAGPLYKESMTVLAQKLGQDHPEMAHSWQQIGEFQETMGAYDKAVSLYKKALAILEKKRGPEHPALAEILRKLAALCVELELESEAVTLYEKLVRIQEKALRPTHPQLVISLNNLAEAYRLQGRYAEAEACYLKSLRINEELHGEEHPSVAAILQELAKLCTSQRKAEEAKQYQERASAIFQKSVEAAEKMAGAEESLTLELS